MESPTKLLRVGAFIDGHNLYKGLAADKRSKACRWLDLHSLVSSLLRPDEALSHVVYCTAFVSAPSKYRRHKTYTDALRHYGVQVHLGRFQPDQILCGASCRQLFDLDIEKESDVRLATEILAGAMRNEYDSLYLITGDSDQVPTLRLLRDMFPVVRITTIFPPQRESRALGNCADRRELLGKRSFVGHLLPLEIRRPDAHPLRCPTEWLPRTDPNP